jgi:hypothetical protein
VSEPQGPGGARPARPLVNVLTGVKDQGLSTGVGDERGFAPALKRRGLRRNPGGYRQFPNLGGSTRRNLTAQLSPSGTLLGTPPFWVSTSGQIRRPPGEAARRPTGPVDGA